MRPRVLVLLIVVFLPALECLGGGRPTISGRVANARTGEPLPHANVFLANTLFGSATSSDGGFLLSGFPPGSYVLVVSCVGYEVQTRQLQPGQTDSLYLAIGLQPRLIEQQEVVVRAERPEEWTRLLRQFKSAFIGETENASLCTVLNPEVINLSIRPGTKILVASADRSLLVENRGLGYRLEIILSKFEWDIDEDHGTYFIYPSFRELTPQANDSIRWAAHRKRSYEGSLKQFLASLVAGRTEEEGFQIFSGTLTDLESGFGHPTTPGELKVERDPLSALWNINFKEWLRVQNKKRGRMLTSFLSMSGENLQIDYRGNLADPLRLSVVGDWARNRVAELLPLY